jgi:peptide/nickel transport system substrate-binding protein
VHTRRDVIRALGAGALGAGAAGLLAACGSAGSGAVGAGGAGTAGAGSPRRGGTFTVGVTTAGTTETINPDLAYEVSDYFRVYALHGYLYRYGLSALAEPSLAESAEPNATATSWTFRLRDEVTFHNGKTVTAEDLLDSVRSHWLSPDSISYALNAQLIDPKRTRVRDSRTVEIGLKIPVADFPSVVAVATYPIVPAGIANLAKNPTGAGPFRYRSFTPGSWSGFTANRDYWETGKPYVDELVIDSSFSDDTARVNALVSGAVDAAPGLPSTQARTLQGMSQVQVLNAPGNQFEAFCIRVDEAPYSDPRVIQALKYAIDRDAIVRSVYDGFASPAYDLAGKGLRYFDASLVRPRDVDRAKALWTAAGGTGQTLSLYTAEVEQGSVAMATLLQEQAQEAGIKIALRRGDPGTYFTSASGYLTRPFSQTLYITVGSITVFYLEMLSKNAVFPETRWGTTYPADNALMLDAIGELDPATAQDKWNEVQRRQFDTGGYLIPATQNWIDGLANRVHGFKANPGGWLNNFNLQDAWLAS